MGDHIRRAVPADLAAVERIYAGARAFMAENGNPGQWGTGHPARAVVERDIQQQNLYVLEDAQGIRGVFAFLLGEDPTYQTIYAGAWRHSLPYGTLHRVAGNGSGGVLAAAVAFAEARCPYLRIDTHEQNAPMRRAIAKAGFQPCGTILTDDGSPRLAFDRCRMDFIRPAREADASRMAEILVFSKRLHYYPIFQDADYAFRQTQVLPLSQEFAQDPQLLAQMWVYDDGVVKGLIRISGREVVQLYVEPCLLSRGIGGALLEFAKARGAACLWVLEANTGARAFYRRHGFQENGVWQYEVGTQERLLRMTCPRA